MTPAAGQRQTGLCPAGRRAAGQRGASPRSAWPSGAAPGPSGRSLVASWDGPAAMPFALGAAGARLGYAALRRWPPGGASRWARSNHRGEPVTLVAGPALAAAAVTAAVSTPGVPGRHRVALAAAGAGAAAFGCYDDLAGRADRRGFRGHLGALAHGEVTSGAIKIGGIGCAAAVAAMALGGRPVDRAVNAALIAGGANLVNLFDLRPGRAIKVAVAAAALASAAGPAARRGTAAPLGAALALLPDDLGERAMLGDAGANALGAMLATAVAAGAPRPARVAALGVIVALTAASERVSFSRVIDSVPVLRRLDMLGRPAAGHPAGPPREAGDDQQASAPRRSGSAHADAGRPDRQAGW